MNKYLIISLFTLSSFFTYAQIGGFVYVPLELDGLEPIWTHVSVDSSLIGHDIAVPYVNFDGYSHLSPFFDVEDFHIISEGYLYIITRASYNIDIAGALIEKIDLETGQLMWKAIFDLRSLTQREDVLRAEVDGDVLRLYNLYVVEPDPTTIPVPIVWYGRAEGHLKVREYDLLTGELLIDTYPDTTNVDLFQTTGSLAKERLFSIVSSDTLEVVNHIWQGNKGTFILIDTISTITSEYLNSTDTLFSELSINLDWPNSYVYNDYLLSKYLDELFWLDYYSPTDPMVNTPIALLNKTKQGITESFEIDIPNKEEIGWWQLMKVDHDLILLRVIYYNDDIGYVFLEHDGNLIKSIRQEDMNNVKIEIQENNEFLITKFDGIVDGVVQNGIYLSDDTGFNKTISYSMKNEEYGIFPDEIQKLDNGDFLLTAEYRRMSSVTAEKGEASAFMRVSPESIGLDPVSTSNVDDLSIPFKLYPNPFADYLVIKSTLEVGYHFELVTLDGRVVRRVESIDQEYFTLEDLDLSSGEYFARFITDKFTITLPVVKVQ